MAMDSKSQNALLLKMAENSLSILSGFPSVMALAETAIDLSRKSERGEAVHAQELGQYLCHPNPDRDLGMQIYNVNDNEAAIKAIDIICYAVGAASKAAFEQQGIPKQIPDPVLESTPKVCAEAIDCYQLLRRQGLVESVL